MHTGTFSFQSGFGDELEGWIDQQKLGCSGGMRMVFLLQKKHRVWGQS